MICIKSKRYDRVSNPERIEIGAEEEDLGGVLMPQVMSYPALSMPVASMPMEPESQDVGVLGVEEEMTMQMMVESTGMTTTTSI